MGEIGYIRSEPGSDIVRHVFCIQGGGRTSLNVNGSGWRENASFTLNATDVHGVVYEISDDREPSKRFQGEDQRGRNMPDVEPTQGNRGGNVPLVMEIEDEIEDSFDGSGGVDHGMEHG